MSGGGDSENGKTSRSCCKTRCTICEWILTFLFLCVTTLAIFLIYWIVITDNKVNDDVSSSPEVCLTPSCIHLTSRILKSLEPSVDPCEDFYRFTCGYMNSTSKPSTTVLINDGIVISKKREIENNVQHTLNELFGKPMVDDELRAFQLTQKYYNACMNVERIEHLGVGTLLNYLNDFGGWPVLLGDSWFGKNIDLIPLLVAINKIGHGYLFDLSIAADKKDSRMRTIYIGEPKFHLPREELIKGVRRSIKVRAYYNLLVELATAFGAQREYAMNEIKDVILFQANLTKFTYNRESHRNESLKYNPTTLRELQRNYTYINWAVYFRYMFPDENPRITIENDEKLVIENPRYMKELGTLIGHAGMRIVVNYLMLQTVIDLAPYLPTKIREILNNYLKIVYNDHSMEIPRWKYCIQNLQQNFPITTSAMYLTQSYTETADKSIELFHEIWTNFEEEIILNVDWMDERTRRAAIAKLNSMTKIIPYPNDLFDTEKIDVFYDGYEVTQNNFLKSFLVLRQFLSHKIVESYRQYYNKSDWVRHAHVTTVEPIYYPEENSIEIPLGALYKRPFADDLPRYTIYGDIAVMMGRAVTKMFNSRGRQFNQRGELSSWWTNTTNHEFQSRVACYTDKLNEIIKPIASLHDVDYERMYDEYMTEVGGVKAAYINYIIWLMDNEGDLVLPMEKYTPQQMFWISYGQSMCESRDLDAIQWQIRSSKVPNSILVNGVTSNSEHFLSDFNCGSIGEDVDVCTLW